jgi:Tfp pilus assembly protein PilO
MRTKLGAIKEKLAAAPKVVAKPAAGRDPRKVARVILGMLLAANVAAAIVAFRPWADSAEQLEQQIADIRRQQVQLKASTERLKLLTGKSETARTQGDKFLAQYFLSRQKAASTLVSELNQMAKSSGIRPKEHAFAFEGIEGSDNLAIGAISANYEGSYNDLLKYVNQLDRSPRFFIVESMGASPQQGNLGVLNIQMKVNVFVREGLPAEPVAEPPAEPVASAPTPAVSQPSAAAAVAAAIAAPVAAGTAPISTKPISAARVSATPGASAPSAPFATPPNPTSPRLQPGGSVAPPRRQPPAAATPAGAALGGIAIPQSTGIRAPGTGQ